MQARRPTRIAAVTTALVALAAMAAPVQAGPPPSLSATPTASPIALAPGESVTVTVTNTDRKASSSRLVVSLTRKPADAPFAIVADGCAGVILRPAGSCTVEVGYSGPTPATDHAAMLTVSGGKGPGAVVTRVIEVGVTFADVCTAHGGAAGHGGTITVLGATFAVAERCDWSSTLATAVYNATFEVLSPECFDLGAAGMIGYPVTAETGRTAMGCVVD